MRKLFTFLLLAAISAVSFAQIVDPVHWTFKVKELPNNEAELLFTAKIDNPWHIYSQRNECMEQPIAFSFDKGTGYQLVGKVIEPKPHEEVDDLFNCTSRSFSGTVTFRQKIRKTSNDDITVSGLIEGQACQDGQCVPLPEKEFSFKLKGAEGEVVAAVETTDSAVAEITETPETPGTIAEDTPASDEPAKEEKDKSLLVIFLIALGGGIVTMFTPCVFPMIPMTVNFFMHSSDNKRKNRREALTFGISIVLLFAVLGAILTLCLGDDALNALGTHWIPNLIFFLIFIIFSLSFFGLFEIKMPEKWINASDAQADKGGFLGPFFIALTTVLVSFSCTGPIIGAALVGLNAAGGDRWVSLLTMAGFGIGFALPFTLLAFFPGVLKNMKSGSWLNTVKVSFAFLELAFGLKFLQMADIDAHWGILPRDIYLALWIVIFALWGFYLLGKLRFKGDDEVKEIGVGRLFIATVDLAFVVYMIPGLWGAPLDMISGFLPPMQSQSYVVTQAGGAMPEGTVQMGSLPADRKYAHELHELGVKSPLGFECFYDLDEAKAYARQQGKPVFIDFTGINCNNCRKMEQSIWPIPEVKKLLTEEFVMVELFADVKMELPESEWYTDRNGRVRKTLGGRNLCYESETFNNNAQPYYVIVDADGTVLTQENFPYNKDERQFIAWLNEGLTNYKSR